MVTSTLVWYVYTGLLVAACVNRAPEGLFGAAVAEVGVLDLLKVILGNKAVIASWHFSLSSQILRSVCTYSIKIVNMLITGDPLGNAWTSDYGNPHDAHDFDFIYPISPLHNVPERTLPPTILLTADREWLMGRILLCIAEFYLHRWWPSCTITLLQACRNASTHTSIQPSSLTHPDRQKGGTWGRKSYRTEVRKLSILVCKLWLTMIYVQN